jgi:peptidoglycan hydrolase-like protein with peptidoglycan-binding domain
MDKIKNSQQKNWYSVIRVSIGICFIAISLVSIFGLSLKNVAYAQYGGGGGGADYRAPAISNINVVVSAKEVTITWITDKSSISWVVYGLTTAYNLEVKTTSYLTSHSVILGNLSSATTYHYQVKSKDSAGNIGTYTDQTFTTLTEGVVPPVTLEEVKIPTLEKPISQMTIPELQAKINEFLTAINQIKAQIAKLKEVPTVTGCPITSFDRNLKQGDISDDVKCLQIILNSSTDTQVATTGVGSPGRETTYFGPLTREAVIKFQEKYASETLIPLGLEKGTGYFGSLTRQKANQLIHK